MTGGNEISVIYVGNVFFFFFTYPQIKALVTESGLVEFSNLEIHQVPLNKKSIEDGMTTTKDCQSYRHTDLQRS